MALLHQFRRLTTRWERRTDIHHGLPRNIHASTISSATRHSATSFFTTFHRTTPVIGTPNTINANPPTAGIVVTVSAGVRASDSG
jgi:hypothetical protein